MSVGAVSCSTAGGEETPGEERQPPNFRRVRLFNASDFKVKEIKVKITKPGPAKDLGKLIQNVDPHRASSKDAGQAGFLEDGTTDPAGPATELEIAIVMLDDGGMDQALPAYTIGVGQVGYKIGDVLICIENHQDPNTWNVTTCTFAQSDELQPLVRHPDAPAPTPMMAAP
jgi:hypothetical protein